MCFEENVKANSVTDIVFDSQEKTLTISLTEITLQNRVNNKIVTLNLNNQLDSCKFKKNFAGPYKGSQEKIQRKIYETKEENNSPIISIDSHDG